jgi:hypothetical protein
MRVEATASSSGFTMVDDDDVAEPQDGVFVSADTALKPPREWLGGWTAGGDGLVTGAREGGADGRI